MGVAPDFVGLFLILGYAGWVQYEAMNHQANDIALNIYLTVQLVSMNSGAVAQPIPLALDIARFGLPVLTLLTAIASLHRHLSGTRCAPSGWDCCAGM
jgi:hypothetical protein